jgi:hypothetical protein
MSRRYDGYNINCYGCPVDMMDIISIVMVEMDI